LPLAREDEQVFGTLSAISKLLHPIESRGKPVHSRASPQQSSSSAEMMSVSDSDSSNHSDLVRFNGTPGGSSAGKSSSSDRAKRMQRWSHKVKLAVAEEFEA